LSLENTATPGSGAPAPGGIPIFARKATGLVREIPFLDQAIFNSTSAPPVGLIIFGLFAMLVFPLSNIYVTAIVAPLLFAFVWITFALMSAAIPRLGGDYTFNSRILTPWLGLAGNVGSLMSATLGAGIWAVFFATQGLSPAFSVIGTVTHSPRLSSWGNYFSPTHKNVTFLVAVAVIVTMSIAAARGTKIAMRLVTIMFLIGCAGLLLSFLILLFTSHSSFVSTVNSAGGAGAYDKTVAAGAHKGLYPSESGYSAKMTLGAFYYWGVNGIWLWWGAYTVSEFKGGGRRSRQLKAMLGTGLVQSAIVAIVIIVFLHTVGYNFFVSSLAGNFAAAGSLVGFANYSYFAALIAGNTLVVAIIAIAFLGWWAPGYYINAAMGQRAIAAWSFDGLLPTGLSKVNERTHTPIIAITIDAVLCIGTAALYVYYTSINVLLALIGLFGFMPIVLVGLSAMIMKWRRPDLYAGSAAEWRVGGIEVLPIAGALCCVIGAALMGLALYFHTELGLNHVYLTAILPFAVIAGCAVWYYGARAFRSHQSGVDIALAYRTIPPD
jgi:amino acid transporter